MAGGVGGASEVNNLAGVASSTTQAIRGAHVNARPQRAKIAKVEAKLKELTLRASAKATK